MHMHVHVHAHNVKLIIGTQPHARSIQTTICVKVLGMNVQELMGKPSITKNRTHI